MGALILIVFLSVSLVGIGAGAIKAGAGMNAYSRGAARAVEATPEQLGRIQVEARRGMIDAVTGTAEAAMNAQTAAGLSVSPNPVGLGFTDGMTLGQKIVEISEGRARAIARPSATEASEASETGSQPGTGGHASETTATDPAGLDIAEAPDDYFLAWYADNIGFNPIRISSTHEFSMYAKAADYEGGGHDRSIELQKVALTGAFKTRAEALEAVKSMMTNERVMSGVYAGQRVATINGETHNLEFLGVMSWWE